MTSTHPYDIVDRRTPFASSPTWRIAWSGTGLLMVQKTRKRKPSRRDRRYRVVIQPRKMSIAAIRASLILFSVIALLIIGILVQAAYQMPLAVVYGVAAGFVGLYLFCWALWKYRPWMAWRREEST